MTMNRVEHNIQDLEDVQAIEHLDFHDEAQCNSGRCAREINPEPHAADWYVRLSVCHHVLNWCQARFHIHVLELPRKVWCQVCLVRTQEIDFQTPIRR